MKKILTAFFICLLIVWNASAQASIAAPDPAAAADSARFSLKEISIDMFEREGSWTSKISTDVGVISARLFDGSPAGKEPIASDLAGGEAPQDTKVLGAKVEFFHRGINTFYITATRPIAVEGVVKTVSVWVAGRNQNHALTLLVQDYFGSSFELYIGTLNFVGWKKMTVAIPASRDGVHGIIQSSPYFGDRPGLRIIGFKVDCDPTYTIGSYYIYFDDLRAYTDMYDYEYRDPDDMGDNW